MINFDDVTKQNIRENNSSWVEIPDHSCRILISGGSGSAKKIIIWSNNLATRYW